MKNKRFQYEYRKSASSLHRTVGEVLRNTEAFKHHKIYQEYPVNKVNPNYTNAKHRFDWVIPDLKLVIECHGIQHSVPIAFIDEDVLETVEKYREGIRRDKEKEEAARQAGYLYIVVDYTEEKTIDSTGLLAKIYAEKYFNDYHKVELNEHPAMSKYKEMAKKKRKEYLASETHKEKLKKARKYNKERYRKLKEFKNE